MSKFLKIQLKLKEYRKNVDFIEKNKFIIFFMIITALSLYLRGKLINYASNDYIEFLKPWFDELKSGGGLTALQNKIGNYNAPYMTILALLTYISVDSIISIKVVSIIFDYICDFIILEILNVLLPNNKNKQKYILLSYCLIIFLPTMFLNSACWGQADSIYTAFILMSLLYLFKKKYTKSFIFLGIAFSFKLQTIFILPLYVLMYLSEKKFSIFNFLLIPFMDFVMCLPAILFGKSILDCIGVYIEQTSKYANYLTLNFPNVYSIFFKSSYANLPNIIESPNEIIGSIGVLFTIFIFIFMAILVLYKKVKFDNRAIIEFGLWSILIATFFLPQMHDRYLFVGDVLGILYYIYNKRKYYIPIAIELISLSTYVYYLFGGTAINIAYTSILNLVVVVLYSKNMYEKYLA